MGSIILAAILFIQHSYLPLTKAKAWMCPDIILCKGSQDGEGGMMLTMLAAVPLPPGTEDWMKRRREEMRG